MDLTRRLRGHGRGIGSRYTRSRLPVRLAAWCFTADAAEARSVEARFKLLTRREKMRLLAADEAFGLRVNKPPSLNSAREGTTVATHQHPQADELPALVETARTSQIRIATDKGDITFTFFADDAPVHSAAFLKLAQAGFYDGLSFHRVEPGFVVQGGDPDGNGTGGPGYRLKAEFSPRPHVRGTVAMARSSQPDSAGSQFYICLDDARFLDNQYTVFGQMNDGFDALDAIRVGDVMRSITVEPKAEA
jgi:peptidylprolyl isomerase/peptidyl-prolyl cis-trans isomerase B (cyclophilin B)